MGMYVSMDLESQEKVRKETDQSVTRDSLRNGMGMVQMDKLLNYWQSHFTDVIFKAQVIK